MATKDTLPDTSQWLPRADAASTLSASFAKRCAGVEQLVRLRAELEARMNVDNFDSGPGVEDIVREELANLLPSRYSVRRGVVSDRSGHTAGDCDIVVFNDFWFPAVKSGATPQSRRFHFPVDGAYAIGEIKSRLDFPSLDNAMQKLVVAQRLERPSTHAYRVTENREGAPCSHGRTNPLYTFIIATGIGPNASFDSLIERFFDINKTLSRREVVRGLCILGNGTIAWGFRDPANASAIKPALFMLEDLHETIFPVRFDASPDASALYWLMADLLLHLYRSVLAPEDIAPAYGPLSRRVKAPSSTAIALRPDADMLGSLQHLCRRTTESAGGDDGQ